MYQCAELSSPTSEAQARHRPEHQDPVSHTAQKKREKGRKKEREREREREGKEGRKEGNKVIKIKKFLKI